MFYTAVSCLNITVFLTSFIAACYKFYNTVDNKDIKKKLLEYDYKSKFRQKCF